MYSRIPVCTGTWQVHTVFLILVPHFSSLWRVYLCTNWTRLSTYFGVPDAIAPAGPSRLLGDSAASAVLRVSITRLASTMTSCLLTSSTSPSQRALLTGVWRTWAWSWGVRVNDELQNIKTILPSSSSEFYSREKAESWSGLKLSSADGDCAVDLEQWLECWGHYCKIFK
jgi:hypothetical protein